MYIVDEIGKGQCSGMEKLEKNVVHETDKNDVTLESHVTPEKTEIFENCKTDENQGCCGCHQKSTPRQEKELKQLKNRLSRITGQLNGIGRMLDENRYCGEILTQVAAVESALQAFGYAILKEHMETCVVEEIQKGNTEVVDEAVELIKKLK